MSLSPTIMRSWGSLVWDTAKKLLVSKFKHAIVDCNMSFAADCATTPEHVCFASESALLEPCALGGEMMGERACNFDYPAILPPQDISIRYLDGNLSAPLNREISWYLLIWRTCTGISFSHLSAQTDWLLSLLRVNTDFINHYVALHRKG